MKLILLQSTYLLILCQNVKPETLRQVHIIFRHGERTPTESTAYPKDPYRNHTFQPFGLGQLTNVGKQTMYNFGQVLQTRYKSLIGDYYIPDLIEAWSTDIPRTKVSLLLVLASLFPPKDELVWNDHLNWQPIPFRYRPLEEDDMLSVIFANPKYNEAYQQNARIMERQILRGHKKFLNYLEENVGMPMKSVRSVWFLFQRLNTQKGVGLKLPEWAERSLPYLEKLAVEEYCLQTATPKLKKLVAGKFLCKVFNEIKDQSTKQNAKMFLYSAHDITIANFLDTLGVFHPHQPNYSASIAIEAHEHQNQTYIKVAYRKSKYHRFEYMLLPNRRQNFTIPEFQVLIEGFDESKEFQCTP